MGDDSSSANRRSVLKRGVMLCAGVFGIGAGAANAASPRPAATAPKAETLRLYGRGWSIDVRGRRFGQLPGPGDRANVYGEILDRPHGSKVGEFYSAWIHAGSPFGDSGFAAGSLELHTFKLADGSIFGLGAPAGEEGVFAISGGTGRYAGARGTYVARQRPHGLGGDGTAEFTLTLTT